MSFELGIVCVSHCMLVLTARTSFCLLTWICMLYLFDKSSYNLFGTGLYDMGLTINDVEIHLLAKLLDRDNSGEIDYTEITKGLQYAK